MGPTKPGENLFFRGIWGWASTLWERLQSTGGRLWSALWSYDGTTWRRQPIIWGWSVSCGENLTFTSLGAAGQYMTFTVVPAGYARHVDLVTGFDTTNAFTNFDVQVFDGSLWLTVKRDTTCAAYSPYGLYTGLTLGPGENVRVRFIGTTVGDSLYATQVGYDMAIAQ